MRVISGKNKGAKLYTLEGLNTRPTLDRVKESLFNIINFDIPGCTFLDLFAGSGSIGIEAASRGAKRVIMCEKAKDAVNIINASGKEAEQSVFHLHFHIIPRTKNDEFKVFPTLPGTTKPLNEQLEKLKIDK